MRSADISIDYLADQPQPRRRAGAIVLERVARYLPAARSNFGGLSEKLSGANEHRSIAAHACSTPCKRTDRDGVAKISRHGYQAGSGSVVGRSFGASGTAKQWRRNTAYASRDRRSEKIECLSALSLDAFSRTPLSQTWLASYRTHRILRQRSRRNVDFPIARPASLVTLASVGDSRRKVWLPVPNARSI